VPLALPESRPAETAVLLIDLQHGLFDAHAKEAHGQEVLARAAELADTARTHSVRVVHCTKFDRPGFVGWKTNTPAWRARARTAQEPMALGSQAASPLKKLGPEPSDLVVPRSRGASPFTGTELDSVLRNLGCTTLVLTGVSLNVALIGACVEAVSRGYEVIVAEDAVLGIPREYGEQMLRHSFRVLSTVMPTEQILAAWGQRWPAARPLA
jgi:nicotinamidase-related amidase